MIGVAMVFARSLVNSIASYSFFIQELAAAVAKSVSSSVLEFL